MENFFLSEIFKKFTLAEPLKSKNFSVLVLWKWFPLTFFGFIEKNGPNNFKSRILSKKFKWILKK